MADRTGGKILDQATIDAMNAQGEGGRKLARQPLRDIAKRRRMRIKERKMKKAGGYEEVVSRCRDNFPH